MPSLMSKKVDETLNSFRFLCKIPSLDITPPLLEDDCFVCLEPYRNNGWEMDGTVHRPVALPCGHTLGLQCLARWVMSANFNNRCPLCGVQIIKRPSSLERCGPFPESPLGRVEALAIMAGEGIEVTQKRPLLVFVEKYLRSNAATALGVPVDQVLVAMEEYLDTMCDESPTPVAAPVGGDRQPVPQQAIIARLLRLNEARLVPGEVEIQVGFYFLITGLMCAATCFVWDCFDEGAGAISGCLKCLLCCAIGYMVVGRGLRGKCASGFGGALAGVIFCGMIHDDSVERYLFVYCGALAGVMFCVMHHDFVDLYLFG